MTEIGKIGAVIGLFIGIIFVMAILPAIADEQGTMTTKSVITNESLPITSAWVSPGVNSSITFTVTDAPTGWKTTGCQLTDVAFANGTVVYTVTTDYTVDASTGVLTLVPTAVINGSGNTSTVISYTGCRDGYITEGGARSITALITLFAGLAVVGFSVFHLGRNFDLF